MIRDLWGAAAEGTARREHKRVWDGRNLIPCLHMMSLPHIESALSHLQFRRCRCVATLVEPAL